MTRSESGELHPTCFPDYPLFRRACRSGLSVVRPFVPRTYPDNYGVNFRSGWPPSYWAFGRMRALLALKDAQGFKPKRVLEVASGDGSLCACLSLDGCETVANDLITKGLELAKERFTLANPFQILGGNLFDLSPKKTGTFDLVLACEVLEHVAHTDAFLRHLKGFVAPGGHLLITTPNGAYMRNKLPTHSQIDDFAALETHQFKPDADGHLFLITPVELYQLAVGAGFVIDRMNLWGTPLLNGHCKLVLLSGRAGVWPAYMGELLAQKLRCRLRQSLCCAISAVLSIAQ
jgi:2-polyprenyl-3-methyl-5-hydroxy-6-metoxy-1,4-benzoquinol methylase